MKNIFFLVIFLVFNNVYAEVTNTASIIVPMQAKINLNTATVLELIHSFKGIGPKRAMAIVAYREKNGKFKSLDDLGEVKGISHNFVLKNREELKKVYMY